MGVDSVSGPPRPSIEPEEPSSAIEESELVEEGVWAEEDEGKRDGSSKAGMFSRRFLTASLVDAKMRLVISRRSSTDGIEDVDERGGGGGL